MNRIVAGLAAAVAVLSLTACDGDSPSESASTDASAERYRAGLVNCYDFGGGKAKMGTCDFDSFYSANPALLEDSSEGEEDNVVWLEMSKGPLACLQVGNGSRRYMACDWARYAANHGEAPAPR